MSEKRNGMDNLIPFSRSDVERAREAGRKGGRAAQKALKQARLEKEAIKEIMGMDIQDFPELQKLAKKYGISNVDSVQKLFNKIVFLKEFSDSPNFDTVIKYQKIAGEYEGFKTNATEQSEVVAVEVFNNILFSDKQEEFINQPLKRINLLYGSVRSGKTFVSLVKFIKEVKDSPEGSEFLIAGKTLTSVNRNCFGTLADLCGKMWNVSLSAKKAKLYGRTVWIEGANDKASESKIRGMTLQGAYIDELTQIPEEFYLMCLSRLSKPKAWLIATTNPDAPKHYVKSEIIDNDNLDKQIIKFTLEDNIHLDGEYIENLKREYTGVYYDRFILGEFVRAEGIIFPEFASDPTPWIISAEEVPKRFIQCEVGLDIGGNGSAYAMTATGRGYDGIQYKLKAEKRQAEDMNMEDIEQFVKDFCGEVERLYNVNIDMINSDHIAVIINTINDNTKYRACLTYKPPLEDRVFLYSKMLASGKVKFVGGMCDDLIDEMQNLVFDDKQDRAVPLDDGSMQIDTWDSNVYSESGYWNYIEA